MKNFINLIQDLKLEYPQLEDIFDEVQDMCLKAIEINKENTEKELFFYKTMLQQIIKENNPAK